MKRFNKIMVFISTVFILSGHVYGHKLSFYMSYGLAVGSKGSGLSGSNSVSTDLIPSQDHVSYPSIGIGRHTEMGVSMDMYKNLDIRLTYGYSVTPTLETSSECAGFVSENSRYTGHVQFGKAIVSWHMPVCFMRFYMGAGLGVFQAAVDRQAEYQMPGDEKNADYLLNGKYHFHTAPGFVGHIGFEVPLQGRFNLALEVTFQQVNLNIDKCEILSATENGKDVLDQIDLNPGLPGNQNTLCLGENNALMSQKWQLPGSNVGFRAGLIIEIF